MMSEGWVGCWMSGCAVTYLYLHIVSIIYLSANNTNNRYCNLSKMAGRQDVKKGPLPCPPSLTSHKGKQRERSTIKHTNVMEDIWD
jgi:hypothetical protein